MLLVMIKTLTVLIFCESTNRQPDNIAAKSAIDVFVNDIVISDLFHIATALRKRTDGDLWKQQCGQSYQLGRSLFAAAESATQPQRFQTKRASKV